MKYLKKKNHMALWKVVILDCLLVGVILVVFAFFHHALPSMIADWQRQQAQLNATQPSETEPTEVTEAPTQATEDTTPTEVTEATEATEPDNRTEWQKKYEEHFTEEVVMTENSYTSPEVSITINTVVLEESGRQMTYYVADIYVASLDNFKTHMAYGQFTYFGAQDSVQIAKDANAILAISGDYLTNQRSGFLVRNGEVLLSDRNNSICALFPDGTMETYDRGTYEVEDILAREPLQVWSFGPGLLDENGNVKDSYEVNASIADAHPRCAVGYYEPGHYCFVVVDGRQNHSYGMRVERLAQVFADLGCQAAYNLDGGATAVMLFGQEIYSSPSNGGRELGDILLITEAGYGG